MLSGREQASGSDKELHLPEGPPPLKRRAARWSPRRIRDAWMFLCVLLLGVGTLITLSSGGLHTGEHARPGTTPARSGATATTAGSPVPAARVIVHAAQVHVYPFPSSQVGLMQLAVDARGNAWVGEMGANRFARLDSRTGVITTWTPPDGKNGIMTTIVDAQGNAWFVEQGVNYLGRFDPVRQTFHTFPLGTVHGRPMGPQDLQFDAKGKLWFTAATSGQVGRLDPATGRVQTWPVPSPAPGISPSPYGLTVLPNGQIWFGYVTGGAVGHLDPTTGQVTLFHLADRQEAVFSIASDAQGRLWFTEIIPGKLGMIDSATGKVAEWTVPAVAGNIASLYRLVVAKNGEIWFADDGASALVRYTPQTGTYTFFQLPAQASGPYGLTLDSAGRLWFSASGTSANAIGEMNP